MTELNVLVLVLDDGFERPLRRAIAQRGEAGRRVRVVAPLQMGTLEWLATDEDAAREQAAERALKTQWSLGPQAGVHSEAGEADPILAVEDALRSFPADEILLVGDPQADDGLEASLSQFGLPVARVPATEHAAEPEPLRESMRGIAGGRSAATPFAVLLGVNVFLLALVGIVALAAALFLLFR